MKVLVIGPGPVRPGAPSSNVAAAIAASLVANGHTVVALDSAADSAFTKCLTGPLDDHTVARIRRQEGFDRIALEGARRLPLTEGPWLGASPEELAVLVPGGTLDVVCASDGTTTVALAAFACALPVAISDTTHRSVDLPEGLAIDLDFRGVATVRFDGNERLGVDRGDISLFAAASLVAGVDVGRVLGNLLSGRSLTDSLGNPAPGRTVARHPSTDFSAWPGANTELGLRAKTFRASLLASNPSIPSRSKERILVTGPERALGRAVREIDRLGHEPVALGRSELHPFRTYFGESLEAVRSLERPDAILDLEPRDEGEGIAPDDAVELHVLAIADGTNAQILGTFEHVERSSVHPDDAAAVFPSLRIDETRIRDAEDKTTALVKSAQGLVTARFALGDTSGCELLGITHGVTTHMLSLAAILEIDLVATAVRVMLGAPVPAAPATPPHVAVEEHVFPFSALGASDPLLDRRARSTGSVLAIAETVQEAYARALASMGVHLRRSGGPFLLSGPSEVGSILADLGRRLFALGFDLVATPAVATWLEKVRVPHRKADLSDPIALARTCAGIVAADPSDGPLRHAALVAAVPCFTTVDLARVAVLALERQGSSDTLAV